MSNFYLLDNAKNKKTKQRSESLNLLKLENWEINTNQLCKQKHIKVIFGKKLNWNCKYHVSDGSQLNFLLILLFYFDLKARTKNAIAI
jgi:hypothetical protein